MKVTLQVQIIQQDLVTVLIAEGSHIDSGLGLIERLTSVSCNHLLRAQYAFHNLAHHSEMISILPNCCSPVGLMDFHCGPAMLEAGPKAAVREMPNLKRLLGQRTISVDASLAVLIGAEQMA